MVESQMLCILLCSSHVNDCKNLIVIDILLILCGSAVCLNGNCKYTKSSRSNFVMGMRVKYLVILSVWEQLKLQLSM